MCRNKCLNARSGFEDRHIYDRTKMSPGNSNATARMTSDSHYENVMSGLRKLYQLYNITRITFGIVFYLQWPYYDRENVPI